MSFNLPRNKIIVLSVSVIICIMLNVLCLYIISLRPLNNNASHVVSKLSQSISLMSPTVDTGNHMISSIASDISGKYPDVAFTCDGHMPPKPDIALSDICIIFSNALSNAFKAACQVDKPYVNMYIKTSMPSHSVFVSVENPFSNKPVWLDPDNESALVTSKKEPGHGYGFANLKKPSNATAAYVKTK